jgi:hypothetical protein
LATLAATQTLATAALGGPYTLVPATGQQAGPYAFYNLVPSNFPVQLVNVGGGHTVDELNALLTVAAGTKPVPVVIPSAQEQNAATDSVWG